MSVFKYHAFIFLMRPPRWRTEQYFPKARWNPYSRILEHAENHFQCAFNVTQQ